MIVGIGTDLVDIRRIEKLAESSGFLEKVFTDIEIDNSASIADKKRRMGYFSKRFAAKEAFAKAMGTGIGKSLAFKDIEVTNDANGKPLINVSTNVDKEIIKLIGKKINYHIDISLSDEYPYAQAFIIIWY